jgi:hypothetical protein
VPVFSLSEAIPSSCSSDSDKESNNERDKDGGDGGEGGEELDDIDGPHSKREVRKSTNPPPPPPLCNYCKFIHDCISSVKLPSARLCQCQLPLTQRKKFTWPLIPNAVLPNRTRTRLNSWRRCNNMPLKLLLILQIYRTQTEMTFSHLLFKGTYSREKYMVGGGGGIQYEPLTCLNFF